MDYFEKLDHNPYEDLKWNIPERKQGSVNIIGGNAQRFRDEVKVAEFLSSIYPVETIQLILPNALKGKLPEMPNFQFLPSSESGSFAESQALYDAFNPSDYNLILGDLSRNNVTGKAIAKAIIHTERTTLITRDAVDLLADNSAERWLMNENIVVMASIAQLSKLLRSIYYPKMLLMSSSLVQVSEILHKFTLSYPVSIVTLHNEQILVAQNGTVKAIALNSSDYSPMTFWSGEAAAKIIGMNLYNPNQFIQSAICAIAR